MSNNKKFADSKLLFKEFKIYVHGNKKKIIIMKPDQNEKAKWHAAMTEVKN